MNDLPHSPGPWRWNPADHSRNVLEDALGEPIAYYDPVFSQEQRAGNRAALEAVPDMLHLLAMVARGRAGAAEAGTLLARLGLVPVGS